MNVRKGLDIILAAAREAPDIAFVSRRVRGRGADRDAGEGPSPTCASSRAEICGTHAWLYAADVLVVRRASSRSAARQHGAAIKLFLYLAGGRVILAPVAADTAELLTDEVNAALVPAGDSAATIRTLRGVAADPARAARLADGPCARRGD